MDTSPRYGSKRENCQEFYKGMKKKQIVFSDKKMREFIFMTNTIRMHMVKNDEECTDFD